MVNFPCLAVAPLGGPFCTLTPTLALLFNVSLSRSVLLNSRGDDYGRGRIDNTERDSRFVAH